MVVDLHNHTTLCNHAKGTPKEYIEKAIDAGTKYFGFSDHAPMEFDKKYRMGFDEMSLYEKKVLDAQKKYADKIKILLGYEVDYLKGYMDERVLERDVDYLIGSVHFLEGWGFDNPEFIGEYKNRDIDEIWQKYFDTVEEMAKSGLFDIVGHLDLIKVFKFMPKKDICDIAHNALMAIKNAGMAMEINMAGYRKPVKEPYPSKKLLQKAFDLSIPITFASDAHEPSQVSMFAKDIVKLAKDVGYSECVFFKKRKINFINI